MNAETCEADGCEGWPQYPDSEGRYHCRDHYDGDPDFPHIPDNSYRTDLIARYKS